MKEYECVSCGHVVLSSSPEGPAPIRWSDGHVCRFSVAALPVEQANEHTQTEVPTEVYIQSRKLKPEDRS